MDVSVLAHLVVGLLAPITSQMETSIQKWGKQSYQQSKRLYAVLQTRFAKVDDGGKASKALQEFIEDPDYGSVVEKKLYSLLQTDPPFADTLRQIIQTGPRQTLTLERDAEVRGVGMANTLGMGRQEIKTGKYSTIEDVQINVYSPLS